VSEPLEIRLGQDGLDEQRDAFVRAHPRGTLFHDSRWRRGVSRVFGHTPHEWMAFRGEVLVGVLPAMRVSTPLRGENLISMPYAVYGGPLGEDAEVERALLEAAQKGADELGVGRLEMRCWQELECLEGLPQSELYCTFVRDLPDTSEDVLKLMPKKSRAEARKARTKHGLELVEGAWYLDDLYRLFLRNKRSLGSPALPRRWFEYWLRSLGSDCFVHLVHRDREPLAAVMSFAYEGSLLAYYSGTAEGADRAYSASNFMYMALQEWAVDAGFTSFDFGRSRSDSGAFKFKSHQGFEPQQLHYAYHLVRHKELPSFTPSNPKTKVLRNAWSKLPLGVVELISPPLARYLP
jgi:FemAB-related protein (PEP-CTERM system-associated)